MLADPGHQEPPRVQPIPNQERFKPRDWSHGEIEELASLCVDQKILDATIHLMAERFSRSFFSVRNRVQLLRRTRNKLPAKVPTVMLLAPGGPNRKCAFCRSVFRSHSSFITRCRRCKSEWGWME